MTSIIQLLPDHVANQIAAGEVVQRPASVVKELIENAVDAKATDIKLVVKDAGKTLIQVIDNGQGMSVTDARLCFERHATSKIKHAEDLFAIHTKGFRGEALASIAAVAHVELKTKQDQEELGTHIIIEGSKVVAQEPIVHPKGTSFLVKNLFFNIPARRNFLKSDSIELRHVLDEFQRVALAHPNIAFTMLHNGVEVFQLPSTNLRQRIVNMFGGKTNEKLVPITENTDLVSIQGFVMKPEYAKKTRGEQFFFVNHRFIKSSYLHHAIMNAYEGLLKEAMHPGYFLYLEVPPHTIDINIHPTKTEIKFEEEQAIYAILRSAAKHSLGQFQIAPILDFERDPNLDTPYEYNRLDASIPQVDFNPQFNPFSNSESIKTSTGNTSFSTKRVPQESWESLYAGIPEISQEIIASIEEEPMISSLFSEEEPEESKQASYFQIQRKYVVSPIKSGLLVMHQNRAHQRILYEQLLEQMTQFNAVSQPLLFPVSVKLSVVETQMLQELQPVLHTLGFQLEFASNQEVLFHALPNHAEANQIEPLIQEVLHELELEQQKPGKQSEMIAKAMAKAMAIKTGKSLTNAEMDHLVHQLFACKEPHISPTQQMTFYKLEGQDLDKKFEL